MSQVSRIIYVIVFVIAFVFVFVFVIVFFFRSYPLITLIKCLTGQNSLRSLFEGVLHIFLSLSSSLSLSLSMSFCWSGHVSSSLWSNVSKVTSLWGCSFKVFSKCICLCLCHRLCLCLCQCHFVGQVMSPHHSDQMSQRSQVSGVALWRCSLNVFVIVIVFVFVFVFVIVFLLVRSRSLITLIKCVKGHKSLGSLFEGVL